MDAGFDFGFQGSTLGFVQGRGRAVAYDRYLKSREKIRYGHLLSHFLSSHDVPGALFQLQGNKEAFRLAAILQMTTGGIPMIYYGEEVGRPGGDWPDNRSPMPWGDRPILPGKGLPRDESLRAFYRKLVGVRNENPELATGAHVSISSEGDLLVFGRRDAATKRTSVVLVNRGWVARTAAYPSPPEVPVPAGEQGVEGLATVPPRRFVELSADTVAGSVWQNLSIERYAAITGRDVLPVVVLAAVPAPGLAAVEERPDTGIAKHQEYALTWFSLAATMAALWVGLNLRRVAP